MIGSPKTNPINTIKNCNFKQPQKGQSAREAKDQGRINKQNVQESQNIPLLINT